MAHPTDRSYSKDHEWVLVDGDVATIGISDFAQDQLGEVVVGIGAGGCDAGEAGLAAGRENLVARVVIDVAEAEEEGFHQLEGVVAVEAVGVEVALIARYRHAVYSWRRLAL